MSALYLRQLDRLDRTGTQTAYRLSSKVLSR
nr:MAG TPA: hypothetical protein [Caudoviricetes sp.]